jgi:CelD/BcsL family acetyltransferase involved in cellulose biosynthesis
MKFTVLPGKKLDAELLSFWRELQNSNPDLASPFFCPEFTAAVSAARSDVESAVIEEDGKIVGFFPFQRGSGGVGFPAGECLSDYHGVICAPGFVCEPAALLKACGLETWDFDHLITGQTFFQKFHHQLAPSPQIDLSSGSDAYMASCHAARSERTKLRNLLRRLERELGPVRVVRRDADRGAFEQVLKWKSMQYARSGVRDLFAVEWIRSVADSIYQTSNKTFSGILSTLYAGETLVAGHFGMCAGHIWHYWFPAYAQEFSKYSPGMILLLKMIECAPEAGLTLIDLGKGQSFYKNRFKNTESVIAEGSVERLSFSTARRQLRRRCRALLAKTPMENQARRLAHYLRRRRPR